MIVQFPNNGIVVRQQSLIIPPGVPAFPAGMFPGRFVPVVQSAVRKRPHYQNRTEDAWLFKPPPTFQVTPGAEVHEIPR